MKNPTKSLSTAKKTFDPKMLEQVFKWVLSGATDLDVAEAIETSFPGQDAPLLLKVVIDRFRNSGELDAQVVRGWCFEATKDLYRRCIEIGDFAGALRAVKQLEAMVR
jgi:hypothetical protein